jgi:hypothetical protein
LSDQEYQALHQTLIKAITALPVNSIFHNQDWFISKRYHGQFDDKALSLRNDQTDYQNWIFGFVIAPNCMGYFGNWPGCRLFPPVYQESQQDDD